MRRLIGVALFYSTISLAHLSAFSTSGIIGPKYSDLLKKFDGWHKSHPQLIEILEYGKSVQGRPLKMIMMRRKGTFSRRPTLLMSGATHGNEYLNIEDRLPEELLAKSNVPGPVSRFLAEGGVYLFVPILNPDGYDTHMRENARGVDLNRDWDVKPVAFKGFKEQETRLLAETLDRLKNTHGLRYQITVDYHCCSGALLHPWSYEQAPTLTTAEKDKHRAVGELVAKDLQVEYGTTGDILGYFPVGTTKDYYFDHYKAAAFTYEGRHRQEYKFLSQHVQMWQDITALVLGETEPGSIASPSKKKKLFVLAD